MHKAREYALARDTIASFLTRGYRLSRGNQVRVGTFFFCQTTHLRNKGKIKNGKYKIFPCVYGPKSPSEDDAAAYLYRSNTYVDYYWRSLYPSVWLQEHPTVVHPEAAWSSF